MVSEISNSEVSGCQREFRARMVIEQYADDSV